SLPERGRKANRPARGGGRATHSRPRARTRSPGANDKVIGSFLQHGNEVRRERGVRSIWKLEERPALGVGSFPHLRGYLALHGGHEMTAPCEGKGRVGQRHSVRIRCRKPCLRE